MNPILDRLTQPFTQLFLLVVLLLFSALLITLWPLHLLASSLLFKNKQFYNYHIRMFKLFPKLPDLYQSPELQPTQKRLVFITDSEDKINGEIARQRTIGYSFVRRSKPEKPKNGIVRATVDFELNPNFVE